MSAKVTYVSTILLFFLMTKMLTSLNLTQADCLLNLPSVSLRNVLQELQTRLASKIKTHCQCNRMHYALCDLMWDNTKILGHLCV